MEQASQGVMELSVIETHAITEVLTELQRAVTKHPTPWDDPLVGEAILARQSRDLWVATHQTFDLEAQRKAAVRVAAMALRFLCDLRPAYTSAASPEIAAMAAQLGIAPDALATATDIAAHTGKGVSLPKANGTKHYIMPMATGRLDSGGGASQAVLARNDPKPSARGPHNAEDEIGFGTPYDSFGG